MRVRAENMLADLDRTNWRGIEGEGGREKRRKEGRMLVVMAVCGAI